MSRVELSVQVPTKDGPIYVASVASTRKEARRQLREAADAVLRGRPMLGVRMMREDGSVGVVTRIEGATRKVWLDDDWASLHWSEVRYAA